MGVHASLTQNVHLVFTVTLLVNLLWIVAHARDINGALQDTARQTPVLLPLLRGRVVLAMSSVAFFLSVMDHPSASTRSQLEGLVLRVRSAFQGIAALPALQRLVLQLVVAALRIQSVQEESNVSFQLRVFTVNDL